jgi:hypothetical protein
VSVYLERGGCWHGGVVSDNFRDGRCPNHNQFKKRRSKLNGAHLMINVIIIMRKRACVRSRSVHKLRGVGKLANTACCHARVPRVAMTMTLSKSRFLNLLRSGGAGLVRRRYLGCDTRQARGSAGDRPSTPYGVSNQNSVGPQIIPVEYELRHIQSDGPRGSG